MNPCPHALDPTLTPIMSSSVVQLNESTVNIVHGPQIHYTTVYNNTSMLKFLSPMHIQS
jgi:hypothetical protein